MQSPRSASACLVCNNRPQVNNHSLCLPCLYDRDPGHFARYQSATDCTCCKALVKQTFNDYATMVAFRRAEGCFVARHVARKWRADQRRDPSPSQTPRQQPLPKGAAVSKAAKERFMSSPQGGSLALSADVTRHSGALALTDRHPQAPFTPRGSSRDPPQAATMVKKGGQVKGSRPTTMGPPATVPVRGHASAKPSATVTSSSEYTVLSPHNPEDTSADAMVVKLHPELKTQPSTAQRLVYTPEPLSRPLTQLDRLSEDPLDGSDQEMDTQEQEARDLPPKASSAAAGKRDGESSFYAVSAYTPSGWDPIREDVGDGQGPPGNQGDFSKVDLAAALDPDGPLSRTRERVLDLFPNNKQVREAVMGASDNTLRTALGAAQMSVRGESPGRRDVPRTNLPSSSAAPTGQPSSSQTSDAPAPPQQHDTVSCQLEQCDACDRVFLAHARRIRDHERRQSASHSDGQAPHPRRDDLFPMAPTKRQEERAMQRALLDEVAERRRYEDPLGLEPGQPAPRAVPVQAPPGSYVLSSAEVGTMLQTMIQLCAQQATLQNPTDQRLLVQQVLDATHQAGMGDQSAPQIPENELMPPQGYQLPGYGDGFRPQSAQELLQNLGLTLPQPTSQPVRPGAPLSQLSATPADADVTRLKRKLQSYAADLCSFMEQPTPPILQDEVQEVEPCWKEVQQRARKRAASPPAPHMSPVSDEDEDDVKEDDNFGLPIKDVVKECIATVAYASTFNPHSRWAGQVRVPTADYEQCCSWSTRFAPHEAEPLAYQLKNPQHKAPEVLLQEYLSKTPEDKQTTKELDADLSSASAALKCASAVNSAADAGTQASVQCRAFIDQVGQALDTFVARTCYGVELQRRRINKLTDELGRPREDSILTKADLVHSAALGQVKSAIDQAREATGVSLKAHRYAFHASLAGVDAASRNVRTTLAKHRQEALRRVVSVPKEKAKVQQAVHRMALELPYSPTSLFGGRTQVVLNTAEASQHRRTQMANLLETYKGSKVILPDNMSGGKKGQKRPASTNAGGRSSKKKRFRGGGGGGNSSAPPKSGPKPSAKAQPAGKQKPKAKRKGKPSGKPDPKAKGPNSSGQQ